MVASAVAAMVEGVRGLAAVSAVAVATVTRSQPRKRRLQRSSLGTELRPCQCSRCPLGAPSSRWTLRQWKRVARWSKRRRWRLPCYPATLRASGSRRSWLGRNRARLCTSRRRRRRRCCLNTMAVPRSERARAWPNLLSFQRLRCRPAAMMTNRPALAARGVIVRRATAARAD